MSLYEVVEVAVGGAETCIYEAPCSSFEDAMKKWLTGFRHLILLKTIKDNGLFVL